MLFVIHIGKEEPKMSKIIFNFGLLIFFISIVIFTQKGMMVQDVIIKSTIIFLVVTILFSVITLTFIKAINKAFGNKQNSINQELVGSGDNE